MRHQDKLTRAFQGMLQGEQGAMSPTLSTTKKKRTRAGGYL